MYIVNKHYNNHAVSNIIAALLLIAIAVAAAVLLYVFSIGLLGALGSGGGSQTKDQLILEAYDWAAGSTLKLSVRNVGSSALNVGAADIYVDGTLQGNGGNACGTMTPGGVACVITVTLSGLPSLVVGASYPIKIVTPDGGVFSYSAIDGQAS